VYDRTRVLDEGMQAGLDGLPIHDCHYPAGSNASEIWREGWECAAGEPDPAEPTDIAA
jgi:ribosome modulation factor